MNDDLIKKYLDNPKKHINKLYKIDELTKARVLILCQTVEICRCLNGSLPDYYTKNTYEHCCKYLEEIKWMAMGNGEWNFMPIATDMLDAIGSIENLQDKGEL